MICIVRQFLSDKSEGERRADAGAGPPLRRTATGSLLASHYAGPNPGIVWRIYSASCEDAPLTVAGVLVLAMPVLNAPWRKIAWPELFADADNRLNARRANAHVRTISRLVVDPRFRGRGVGSALVRHVLAECGGPARCAGQPHLLEAVASMGLVIPVFASAGMVRICTPPSVRRTKLELALARAGLCHADLIDPAISMAIATAESGPLRRVAIAVRLWARNSGGTRKMLGGPALSLHAAAARGLADKAVFVSGRAGVGSEPAARD